MLSVLPTKRVFNIIEHRLNSDILFIADDDEGLKVINITNLKKPVIIG